MAAEVRHAQRQEPKPQSARPAKSMPDPINATPEELAEAFLRGPPDHQWDYLKDDKKGGAAK